VSSTAEVSAFVASLTVEPLDANGASSATSSEKQMEDKADDDDMAMDDDIKLLPDPEELPDV